MSRKKNAVVILGLIATSCKFQSNSELKATPEQKEKLRSCITSTVLAAFPEAKANSKELDEFSLELSQAAPGLNSNVKDSAFEEYVTGLGCDPAKSDASNSYGITIIEKWLASPHNKAAIGPKDSSASELRALRLNSQAN